MQEQDKQQFLTIIHNIAHSLGHYPFFDELSRDPILATLLPTLSPDEHQEIHTLLDTAIEQSRSSLEKTKGGQYFHRFVMSDPEMFRSFRRLNQPGTDTSSTNFQTIGKKIEAEMFRLEGLLTQTMFSKPQGLAKTTDAFYTIVYRYFPLFGDIRS